jgi:hypothetical protein
MATKKTAKRKKATKRAARPTTGRRRSGNLTSSKAGKLLAQYKAMGVSGLEREWYVRADDKVKWSDVAAIAASVVNQDEHKGRRGK